MVINYFLLVLKIIFLVVDIYCGFLKTENIFELSVLGHFSLFLFFLVKLLHISSSQSNRKDVIIYQVYIYEYYITVSI